MSLKGTEYENAEEANFRLHGTIVLYDGEPVYISQVAHEPDLPKGDIFRVYTQSLPVSNRRDPERKYISSGKFDLAPFKMGFINLDGNVFYLSRTTARQNRQGLNDRTFEAAPLRNVPGVVAPSLGDLIRTKEFYDTIKGRYPSMEDAMARLREEGVSGVAISREYALVTHSSLKELLFLFHRKTVVGFMQTGDREFKLGQAFKFLKEELNERKIPFKE
jgi:hypothetical protein